MASIFKLLRMREAIFRRETRPVVLEEPEFATIHLTPLPSPTPDSIHSRKITLPYRQYHGVMLAQFQTRRLTPSRAEISRQLMANRNCRRQPQATERTANMLSD
jgi:hypothetical protein